MKEQIKRRDFVKKISAGMLLSGVALNLQGCDGIAYNKSWSNPKKLVHIPNPNVALIKGVDRKTNMYDALKLIEKDIMDAIGDKQVVIKPNLTRVKKEEWLASTHVDNIEAVLEFLKPFYNKKVIIAEGTGPGDPIETALENFDYYKLREKYNVEFFDLMKDDYTTVYLQDGNLQPMPIAASNLMLDPNVYLISAAVMKTHSLAVLTLGLKNILLASPMNFGGRKNERSKLHKDPVNKDPRYFNYNMFRMAQYAYPDLALIDGFVGMEGEGPLFGDPVDVGVAIASTDCIAADRVGTEIMDHDFNQVGHLVHCANAKMGEGDLTKINILGDQVSACKKHFRPTKELENIVRWS